MSGAVLDLARLAHCADEAADARIDEIAGSDRATAIARVSELLDALLRWRPGEGPPPDALEVDSGACAALPEWALRHGGIARLERAQQLFAERELAAFVVLGFASLPACYRQPQIAELLASTGRLAIQVFRRLRETANFVGAVALPGGFEPDGLGWLWCRKVRLVHAAMRFLARLDPPELPSPTGRELQDFLLSRPFAAGDPEPIDQTELAFVLQTFSYLTVRALRVLRIRLDTEEASDWVFLWSVVGHLLGVRDELLPRPADGDGPDALEARARGLYEQLDAWNHASAAVSDSGRLLTATLIVSMREAMLRAAPDLAALRRSAAPWHPLRWLPPGLVRWIERAMCAVLSSAPRSFTRLLLGRHVAQELGVERAPLLHYFGHQVAFLLAGRVTSGIATSAEVRAVPRAWARTPAEFGRRNAVLWFARHVDAWRRLPVPPLRGFDLPIAPDA